jgi:surfeit locus 1 family protein
MRRLPLIPTIIVAAAVAVMIGLGVWQLQRAQWKERLLGEYAVAASMPALDLDPLLARDQADLPPLSFRRVLVTCRAENAEPRLRGGRSATGQGGYSYFIPCRAGAEGLAGRLLVNVGWSALPDDDLRLSFGDTIAGILGTVENESPIVLTCARAVPPLQASAAPTAEDIPNNHLAYALQWFFFAGVAALIYVLALRRRGDGELPPAPAAPKSRRS